ncbi:MAG: protein kinase [Anaerolineaceae bacterium]|nr:protein kinase [Anaerolineaceae bacterium]
MLLPETIHYYAIQSVLGEGEIAIVYRATNTRNGQEVALKVLLADSPVLQARQYFENERTIIAGLNHPNIPAFYDYLDAEQPGIALMPIDGKDGENLLAELSEGEFLNPRSVVEWGIQIADALAYLHNCQPPVVFRDLKSAHIMVEESNKAWLVDFNLAKIMPDSKYLSDADLMGTEGFAAPEQYNGVVSPLVDVYGLGATLHHLLTHVDPRHERSFTYAPPRSFNPTIPKSVAQVVMKALAYEPEDRYACMEDMRDALRTVLQAEGWVQ